MQQLAPEHLKIHIYRHEMQVREWLDNSDLENKYRFMGLQFLHKTDQL